MYFCYFQNLMFCLLCYMVIKININLSGNRTYKYVKLDLIIFLFSSPFLLKTKSVSATC